MYTTTGRVRHAVDRDRWAVDCAASVERAVSYSPHLATAGVGGFKPSTVTQPRQQPNKLNATMAIAIDPAAVLGFFSSSFSFFLFTIISLSLSLLSFVHFVVALLLPLFSPLVSLCTSVYVYISSYILPRFHEICWPLRIIVE